MKSGDLSNNQSNENNRAENGNRETEQTQAVEQSEESGETKNDCIKKENEFHQEHILFSEATNGFEPMIRELQSHALPLG